MVKPELRMLSENRCPNAGLDFLAGDRCNPEALTIYGYCGYCWHHPDRIPKWWLARVHEHLHDKDNYDKLEEHLNERERSAKGATVIQFPQRRRGLGDNQPRPTG